MQINNGTTNKMEFILLDYKITINRVSKEAKKPMIKQTKWKPDTCDCTITFEYDDSLPQQQKVFSYSESEFNKKCPYHSNLEGQELYAKVKSENVLKNTAFDVIAKTLPDLMETVDTPDGLVEKFKDSKKPKYEFDEKRQLKIILPSTQSDKAKLDIEFSKLSDPITVVIK